jgi:type VI secretion system protein ImpC
MAEVETEAAGGAEATAFGSSDFENLLQKEFRPKSDQAKSAVEQAVKTLAAQALSPRSTKS